jgi:putative membrane protein
MNSLRLFANGFLIGIANIIPGMSGGTLALVLGIYERLIGALRRIGLSTVKKLLGSITLRKDALTEARAELRRIDFSFLVLLGSGAIVALLLTSKLIVYLLNDHHDATYGFFSGLILTSILIPVRMLKRFGVKELIVLVIAVALILSLSLGMGEKQLERVAYKSGDEATVESRAESTTGFPTYWELGLFFGSGALAISAMILPGISGSFLMLALGVYFPLLTAINTLIEGVPELFKGVLSQPMLESLLILGFAAVGCLFGLLAFTRLLNYLLERYRNLTIAFLIGLMVGSLYGLWPFREFAMVDGERIDTAHILPQLDANLLITIGAFLVGGGIIVLFTRLEN